MLSRGLWDESSVTILSGRKRMKKVYVSPRLVEYGRIADCTFATPGGFKGCTRDCHIDNFGEQSANSTTSGS